MTGDSKKMNTEDENYELKIAIAKLAYNEIIKVINKYEDLYIGFDAGWIECITIFGEQFKACDLREEK